jgi:hypothetical protein
LDNWLIEGDFTDGTEIERLVDAWPYGFVAVTLIVRVPVWLTVGVQEIKPLLGSIVMPEGALLSEKVGAGMPVAVIGSVNKVPTVAVALAGVVIVGAVTTGTEMLKLAVALPAEFLAATVTLIVPVSLSVGVQEINPELLLILIPAGALVREKVGAGVPVATI